jgi:hypothetical protein
MAKNNKTESIRQTVVFGGPDYISSNFITTTTEVLRKNVGFPYGEYFSVLEAIQFLIKEYIKKGIKDEERGFLWEIENFFTSTVIEANILTGSGGLGIEVEVLFNAKNKDERIGLNNKAITLVGTPVFRKIVNQIPFGFWDILQQAQNLIKREKEVDEREAELKKREGGKVGKFKRSGHLTDQILKYNYPKDRQPSLFDNLQSQTLKDIEVAGVEVAEIVEGIKLSPSETKIIDCLCRLLHETSQNLDPKKEDYYSGNIGYELVQYGGDKDTPAPKLGFTLYELTREYKGGEQIGGKDVENVRQLLTEMDSKRFLLSYVETTKKKDGGRIERKIEDFRKLLHIVKISQTEYSKEDIELSKTEETVILLNPIFRRQIDSKFILYPNDINRRTVIAYGSHNLSDVALRLRDYLMRELSSKHYQPEIAVHKLYYLLAEKWMRESRKKKVKEYTDKAIETVKALGLLLSYEIKKTSTGEPKIVFTLNKEWE